MAARVKEQVAIDEHIRRAAAGADVDALSDAMTRRLFDEQLLEHARDPDFWRAGHASVRDNIAALFGLLAGDPTPDDPTGPEAFAVLTVDAGLSSRDLERLYRRGQSLAIEMWLHTAESYARRHDVVLSELLDRPNEHIHQFLEGVVARVLSAYDVEVARRRRSREERRARLVMQLLSGELTPNLEDVDTFLDYHLAAAHLAFYVRAEKDAISAHMTKSLVRASTATRALVVRDAEPGSWLIWLADGQDTPELRRLLAELPLTGAYASGGTGYEGFRVAYERAARAAAAQAATGRNAVVSAREVHLYTLLLADPSLARDFATLELGSLGEESTTAARLRETLLVFLETGSQVGAASRLKVHEHTIRNRVRQAEELLGFSLASRRTELELALRLREILGPPDDPGNGRPQDRAAVAPGVVIR